MESHDDLQLNSSSKRSSSKSSSFVGLEYIIYDKTKQETKKLSTIHPDILLSLFENKPIIIKNPAQRNNKNLFSNLTFLKPKIDPYEPSLR